jgi:hypothetical protein
MITKNRSRNVKRKRKTQEGFSPFYPLFNDITFSQTQTGTTALVDVAYATKNILTGQFPSKKKKNLRNFFCFVFLGIDHWEGLPGQVLPSVMQN